MNPSDAFEYNPDTGLLFFKHRGRNCFKTERGYRVFEGKYAGKLAGHISKSGYVQVRFNGKLKGAHTLAWWIYHGDKPSGLIDHIDGNPTNNRIANLRLADKSNNAKNAKKSDANTSGVTGVAKSFNGKRWRSYITSNRKTISLGVYDKFEDAVKARKEAERNYGFSENHGR